MSESVIHGASPENKDEIQRLYDKLVKYFKDWLSYERLPKEALSRAFAATSRLDMDSMQGASKQKKNRCHYDGEIRF